MTTYRPSNLLCTPDWFFILLCCVGHAAVADVEPDYLMDSDPTLHPPAPVQDIDPNLTLLWMEALNRPESDLQRMTAETIARAHLHGIPDLDQAVPRLEEILLADDSHPAARFAAARALIVLESRGSSDKLFAASQSYGADLRQLVEPALADWGNPSAKEVWIGRLASAETRPRDLILAMRGLGEVREQSALPNLLSVVSDLTRNPSIRLEAAAAAGEIAETGLEEDAASLANNTRTPLFVNQLCAVRLLARHTSERSRQLLIELAQRAEPAVAAAALERLNEIDSTLVVPLAEAAIQRSDPEVRRQGAISLLRNPAVGHIRPLSQLLADPHPGLRHEVCEGLYNLSKEQELAASIREAALQILMGEKWQGQEQASLLLGALDEEPAAERLVELLQSPRAEVRVPAAWALRKLAIPETIPDLIEHAERLTEFRRNGEQDGLDEQVAHLLEALGVLRAEEATPLLMKYVPKRVSQNTLSRGAAIWALGRIYEGTGDDEIETALTARILDFEPQPSEVLLVKEMSAIALGRMQADDRAPMLRQYAASDEVQGPPSGDRAGVIDLALAVNWAVKELTGEELPPPRPGTVSPGDWFLEPIP